MIIFKKVMKNNSVAINNNNNYDLGNVVGKEPPMKKLIISIISVFTMIGLVLLYVYKIQGNDSATDSKENNQYVTNNIMTGKIVEIIGDNEIFVEITKERGKLFLGDLVRVKYEIMLLDELNIPDNPQIGDVISVIYTENDLQEESSDDLQYVMETKEVYKHVYDNIVKIQIVEIIDDSTVSAKVIDEEYEDDRELEITYKEIIVVCNKENAYATTKGKVEVGDEVLIQYLDNNITQEEDKVIINCDCMVK